MRRLQLLLAAVVTVCLASPAASQGRVTGTVLDTAGKPIKGATVRAVNEEAYPPQLTSTTDQKGRFAMIGLRAGVWNFITEAPNYIPEQGNAPIRAGTAGPPIQFVLRRAPEPIPGALARDIEDQLTAAGALRTQGRFDEAIAAYQAIQSKNPTLTAINLVLAGVYREKAEREQDKAARQTLLDQAIASYAVLLKGDGDNDRAKLELGVTQAAAGNVDAAARTFQAVVDDNSDSAAAAEAAAHLKQLKN